MAATSFATLPTSGPATRQDISPPTFLAAVIACLVAGRTFLPLCSTSTNVDWHLDREWEAYKCGIIKIRSETTIEF